MKSCQWSTNMFCNNLQASAEEQSALILTSEALNGQRKRYDSIESFSDEETAKKINYDDVLEELGEFGPWQKKNLILLWLPAIATGIFVTTYSFTGLEPSNGFRCALDFESENATFKDLNASEMFPRKSEIGYDFCLPYKYENGKFNPNATFDLNSCPNILYEEFSMSSTLVTDLGLVCNQQFKVALVGSIYMFGLFFGSFIFGSLGDKIGRRKTLALAVLLGCTGSLCGAFCSDYYAYCLTRFITALGDQGSFLTAFSLSVELVGNERKTMVGNLIIVPFSIGEIILVLAAMSIKEWWKLQIAVTLPLFALLALYFVLPESPRWLIATGRFDEAKETIKKAARVNQVHISPSLLRTGYDNGNSSCEDEKPPSLGISDLFKNKYVRNVTLIMFFNWIVITLGFYGISMSATSLGGDVFISYILASLVEIPSYVGCFLVMDHWGRKPLFVTSLFCTGLCTVIAAFLAEGIFKTGLVLMGKSGAAAAICIVYLYTAEMYPTVIRSTAVGLCSMMARIGGIAAPQVAIFLPKVAPKFLPMVVMGGSCIIGAVLSLWLPETLGALLPETLNDIEHLKNNRKGFFTWWSKEALQARMLKHAEQQKNVTDTVKERCSNFVTNTFPGHEKDPYQGLDSTGIEHIRESLTHPGISKLRTSEGRITLLRQRSVTDTIM